MTLTCPGDAHFAYDSRPTNDRTKITCFYIRLKKLEPEILNCQNRKRCSRVRYLKEVSVLQLATSSSIAIVFEELNDEDKQYHRVSRLEHRQHVSPRSDNMHTVDLEGSDQDDTTISCMVYFRSWLSARLSMATKRTRSRHSQSP